MNILYQSPSLIPSKTANSVHVMNIASALSAMGHTVQLAVYTGSLANIKDDYLYYGVKKRFTIHKLSKHSRLGKIKFLLESLLLAFKKKPDLVISRCPWGAYLLALFGFKVTLDAHEPLWTGCRLNPLLYKLFIRHRNILRITTNSESLKQMFLSHPHNPTAPVITAHNGSIEHNLTDLFPGFLKSSFDVGYIGAFYQGRGLDIVLSIASRLPEISFHLAGGQIEELKQLAPGSEVPSNIHVYGFISPSETYQFRNSCDLLLAPYHRSGVSVSNRGDTSQFMNPIKIIEYMSAQKPIVASDLPAIREVLDKGCALLVDPDSPQEWIEAIKELSLNPSLRDTLSHKSYQRFKASLTWNKRAEKLISIKD